VAMKQERRAATAALSPFAVRRRRRAIEALSDAIALAKINGKRVVAIDLMIAEAEELVAAAKRGC
jgi:hypothetical protein